jgi:hypothetical protein
MVPRLLALVWLLAAIAAPWQSVQVHARSWEALFLSGLCVTSPDPAAPAGTPGSDKATHHHAGQCCLPASRADLALPAVAVAAPALPPPPATPGLAAWPAAGPGPARPDPARAPQSPRGPPGHG